MNAAPDMDALEWADWDTRFVLFTGKGGVGKTTVASAVAVALADAGRGVLLVSTDPASNLADVLQVDTGDLTGSGTRDPVLAARASLEAAQLHRVTKLADRVWLVPYDPTLAKQNEAKPLAAG